MLSDALALPPANEAGQERRLARVARSTRQGGWLAVMRVLSRPREGGGAAGAGAGTPPQQLQPGQREWSFIKDGQAALTSGQWWVQGCVGGGWRAAAGAHVRAVVSPARPCVLSPPAPPNAPTLPTPLSTHPPTPPHAPSPMRALRRFMPGADAAFVGGRDELVAVLTNSGLGVAVYETPKLQKGSKPLYRADLKEGPVVALHPGARGWAGGCGWAGGQV